MRALILAAGRGSRLGAATDDRPKGLVELRGRPLIAWQLDALRSAGVEDVAIVRGYRGEALLFDVRYFDNERWNDTSMVASLACAASWLREERTLVTYADVVYAPEVVTSVARTEGDVVVPYDVNWLELWRKRFADPLTDAETFRVTDGGRLAEIGRRPARLAEIGGQYMGLLALTPVGAARLLARFGALSEHERRRVDVTALLDLAARGGETIDTVPFDGWWCEVDSPADLAVAERIVEAT